MATLGRKGGRQMRLINADALVRALSLRSKKAYIKGDILKSNMYKEIAELVDKMPPANMVVIDQIRYGTRLPICEEGRET